MGLGFRLVSCQLMVWEAEGRNQVVFDLRHRRLLISAWGREQNSMGMASSEGRGGERGGWEGSSCSSACSVSGTDTSRLPLMEQAPLSPSPLALSFDALPLAPAAAPFIKKCLAGR